jgi:3-methyladenine DNA glycosylase/8-oxoguanine DNA glycosylase
MNKFLETVSSCQLFLEPCLHRWAASTNYTLLICLILTRRISFKVSRAIRQRLYDRFRHKDQTSIDVVAFDPIEMSKITLKEWTTILKAPKSKYKIVQYVTTAVINNKDIYSLKIGTWTMNALKIMKNKSKNLFLEGDSYIVNNMTKILHLSSKPTKSVALELANKVWPKDRLTEITIWLWRIKDTGIHKYLKGKSDLIDETDFL